MSVLALRSSEGCRLTSPSGPDQAEQHLHRVSPGVQTKHQSQLVVGQSILPRGLPPNIHAMCAVPFLPMLFAALDVPDDLDCAIRVASSTSGVIDRKGVVRS